MQIQKKVSEVWKDTVYSILCSSAPNPTILYFLSSPLWGPQFDTVDGCMHTNEAWPSNAINGHFCYDTSLVSSPYPKKWQSNCQCAALIRNHKKAAMLFHVRLTWLVPNALLVLCTSSLMIIYDGNILNKIDPHISLLILIHCYLCCI